MTVASIDSSAEINVLIRGQSNAWLFADHGGAAAVEADLEARLGVGVNILASYGEADSTIHSATPFMTWDTEGQQASLLRFLNSLPAEVKDNPTITLWMHNEYDQQGSFSSAEWVNEVRIDAALVREALGQDASTTPYVFEYIPYGWGGNGQAIRDGMASLAADRSFNASIGPSINDLAMDGDGNVGAHMSDSDVQVVADRLDTVLPGIAAPLVGAAAPAPAPVPSPSGGSGATVSIKGFTTVVTESFDDGTGMFSRYWGDVDTSVPGQITIHAREANGFGPGADGGAMVPPTGADAGYGYGLYSFTVQFEADARTGGYALLWPGTDDWPGPELDVVELDFNGNPYSTIHWKGSDGGNAYDSHDLSGFDPTGVNTYSLEWMPDHISVYVNGVLQYTTYDNVPKSYADGGENSAPGVGMQTWWAQDVQKGDNHITAYEFSYAKPDAAGTVVVPGAGNTGGGGSSGDSTGGGGTGGGDTGSGGSSGGGTGGVGGAPIPLDGPVLTATAGADVFAFPMGESGGGPFVINGFQPGVDRLDVSADTRFASSTGWVYDVWVHEGTMNGVAGTYVQWSWGSDCVAFLKGVTGVTLDSLTHPVSATPPAPRGLALTGTKGADTLTGGTGYDTIDGLAGHDLLTGDSGRDVIRGWQGNDTLHGGDGADRLRGGPGDDLLIGGAGKDCFIFTPNGGHDRVEDFTTGIDRLQFHGIRAAQVSTHAAVVDGTSGLLLDYGSGDIFLAHVTALAARDMVFA